MRRVFKSGASRQFSTRWAPREYGTKGAGASADLDDYTGESSLYRNQQRLRRLYHGPADDSVSASAVYMDQTKVFDLLHESTPFRGTKGDYESLLFLEQS